MKPHSWSLQGLIRQAEQQSVRAFDQAMNWIVGVLLMAGITILTIMQTHPPR